MKKKNEKNEGKNEKNEGENLEKKEKKEKKKKFSFFENEWEIEGWKKNDLKEITNREIKNLWKMIKIKKKVEKIWIKINIGQYAIILKMNEKVKKI